MNTNIEQLIKDLAIIEPETSPVLSRRAMRLAADTLECVMDIKPETHPSWNCNDEFNRGWKAFHEQLTAALSGETE